MVNTCGFVEAAKKDSVDTLLAASDLKADGSAPGRVVRWAAWPSATARTSPSRCPRPTPCSGFDDYPDIADRLPLDPRPASSTTRTPRRTAAGCCRSVAGRARTPARVVVPGHTIVRARTCPPARPRVRPPRRTTPARRRADGPAQAGQRLRPALHVLRDPVLPRLLRLPPARATCSARRAGWPSRASRSCSWSARTPRPTARTSATCGCSRRCCPSSPRVEGVERVRVSYLQPAETRPGLVTAIASTPGVAAYYDLSFQHASNAGAAPDAALRRPGELPRA